MSVVGDDQDVVEPAPRPRYSAAFTSMNRRRSSTLFCLALLRRSDAPSVGTKSRLCERLPYPCHPLMRRFDVDLGRDVEIGEEDAERSRALAVPSSTSVGQRQDA